MHAASPIIRPADRSHPAVITQPAIPSAITSRELMFISMFKRLFVDRKFEDVIPVYMTKMNITMITPLLIRKSLIFCCFVFTITPSISGFSSGIQNFYNQNFVANERTFS